MNMIEMGRVLYEAKRIVKEQGGRFEDWLAENFSSSPRTARRYINLYKRSRDLQDKIADVSRFDSSQLDEILVLSDSDIEPFLKLMKEQGTPVEDMSIKELRNKIKEYNQQKLPTSAENDQAKKKKLNSLANTLNGRPQPIEESEPYLKLREENSALAQRVEELEKQTADTPTIQKLKSEIWSLKYDLKQYKLMKDVLNKSYSTNDSFARYVDNEGAGDGTVLFIRDAIPYTDLRELVMPFLVRCGLSQKLPDTLEELKAVVKRHES